MPSSRPSCEAKPWRVGTNSGQATRSRYRSMSRQTPKPNVAGGVRVAELGERDAELCGPAERVDRRGDVPHAVPRRVLLVVVVDRVVPLHAVRVDGELEAGAPVVVGVDDDLDLVRRPAHVAARERAHDAVRVRVVRAHEDVEVAVVERGPELGAERRVRADAGLELAEIGDRAGGSPDGVVGAAVDARCGRGALRDRGRGRARDAERGLLGGRGTGGGEHEWHRADDPGCAHELAPPDGTGLLDSAGVGMVAVVLGARADARSCSPLAPAGRGPGGSRRRQPDRGGGAAPKAASVAPAGSPC